MDYHSDVGFALKRHDYLEMLEVAEENKELTPEDLDFIREGHVAETEIDGERITVLDWRDVNWNPEQFPVIAFIMNYMEKLMEYEFLRVSDTEIEAHLGPVHEWGWECFGVRFHNWITEKQ